MIKKIPKNEYNYKDKINEIIDWINDVVDLDKTLQLPESGNRITDECCEKKPKHIDLSKKEIRDTLIRDSLED